jgi:hypothetical protein
MDINLRETGVDLLSSERFAALAAQPRATATIIMMMRRNKPPTLPPIIALEVNVMSIGPVINQST